MNIVEVQHRPDASAVGLGGEPFQLCNIVYQVSIAEFARLGVAWKFEKKGKGVTAPEINRIVAIPGKLIEIVFHELAIVEPREVGASDRPVIGALFHPKQVRAADAK